MDSYTPELVKQVAETMEQRPDLLGESLKLSTFALECMVYASERKGPISPSSPALSDVSHLSARTPVPQDSGTTLVSTHGVSDYQRTSYYNGITDRGEHPDLLYPHQVASWTPLNNVWSTVGPEVRDRVKSAVKTRYSIDPARFVTHGEDGEDTLGPVVIWVAVHPGSTSADTAHKVSQDILVLLKQNGVEDVEVEWHEAVTWKAIGPALLRVVGSDHPTAHVRRHLTASLGIPIATAEREEEDAQGTVGFFFHENRDKEGNPSTKVFGVSNHHVLRRKVEKKYEFRGAGAPRQYVRVSGLRRFQKSLDEIKVAISRHGSRADLHTREIIKMEKKETSQDEEVAEEDAEQLRKTRQNLDEQKRAITVLEQFYKNIKTQWSDIVLRNTGHVHYSPPISVDVEGEGYTEDWGTFELDEAQFTAQFTGNVVDLGTTISSDRLTEMMHSRSDGRTSFKYPEGRQLRINGVVTQKLLADPDLFDGEDKPCLILLKNGCTTDLTVGRYAGLESFLCDENGVESIELAIYNYDKQSGPFSAKGDSGSLIFDGLGRMVALLHSGKSKNDFTSTHVTYAAPAWWVIDRIKKRYPHADFDRTTW